MLVGYKITRGITLIVGRVNDWVCGGFGEGFRFFCWCFGGCRGVCLTFVGHFLPVRKSCMAPDLVPNTTYWSNWPMFTG